MYERTRLSDLTALGAVPALPFWLNGIGASDDQIRDTTWAGYPDEGFWPVTVEAPTFDAATQTLTAEFASYVADPAAKTWTGTYGVRALTADETAARLAASRVAASAQVDTKRDAKLTGGYTHDFGGTIGVKVLQTRDADDKLNWLTSQAAYSAAVAGGQGATMGANFRAADNTTFTLSYADGLNVLLAMAAWGASVYGRSWALKDAIAAAADPASVDITTGWPA